MLIPRIVMLCAVQAGRRGAMDRMRAGRLRQRRVAQQAAAAEEEESDEEGEGDVSWVYTYDTHYVHGFCSVSCAHCEHPAHAACDLLL